MESKWVIALQEEDFEDKEINIIGVASNRDKAMTMIQVYYGRDAKLTNFKDIRDSMLDFSVKVYVPGSLGGTYLVTGIDFEIDNI